MGFIKGSFNMNKCADILHEKKDADTHVSYLRRNNCSPLADIKPYVFTNLLIPLLRSGELTLTEIDFSRFEREEIWPLADSLYYDCSREFVAIGIGICGLNPAATDRTAFI